MKITTAWKRWDVNDDAVAVFAVWDEPTWGSEPPERYVDAVGDARRNGYDVRELVLNVPYSAIEALFTTPEVEATPEGDEITPDRKRCKPCTEGRHSACRCDWGDYCGPCKRHTDAHGPFAVAPDDAGLGEGS